VTEEEFSIEVIPLGGERALLALPSRVLLVGSTTKSVLVRRIRVRGKLRIGGRTEKEVSALRKGLLTKGREKFKERRGLALTSLVGGVELEEGG